MSGSETAEAEKRAARIYRFHTPRGTRSMKIAVRAVRIADKKINPMVIQFKSVMDE